MTAPASITISLPAHGWQSVMAPSTGFVGIAVNLTKRARRRAQGCFPMTD